MLRRQDKRSLKLDLKEMELAHEDVVRQLKLDNAKEITKLRQEFELNAKELQNKYEKKVRRSQMIADYGTCPSRSGKFCG
jgi:hypothetical protein